MSAVRMVAYGVLEMKHKTTTLSYPYDDSRPLAYIEQNRKDDHERDQLRKLVNDELVRYGLLLSRLAVPKGVTWRTKANGHILYGQLENKSLPPRQILHQGSFKECCEVAAKLLDELDASQLPDIATGPL